MSLSLKKETKQKNQQAGQRVIHAQIQKYKGQKLKTPDTENHETMKKKGGGDGGEVQESRFIIT